jgi:hypothetical protein
MRLLRFFEIFEASPSAPPRTPSLIGPACGAGRHPSSPVLLLHEPTVFQNGISAQIIQLLVPVAADYIGALHSFPPLPPGVHCPCHSLRHLGPAAAYPAQQRPHSPYLLALHPLLLLSLSALQLLLVAQGALRAWRPVGAVR